MAKAQRAHVIPPVPGCDAAWARPYGFCPPYSPAPHLVPASDTVVILEFHFISFVIVNVEYISIAAFADVIFAQEMAGSARGHKPA